MNKLEYKGICSFHPGYYVAEVIEDMGVSQKEFAESIGTTKATLGKLINSEIALSCDLAKNLAAVLGTGVEVWVNLQSEYDRQKNRIDCGSDG